MIDDEGEYRGEFQNGERNGKGAIVYKDNNSYKGN
jgi:hypothetical protein